MSPYPKIILYFCGIFVSQGMPISGPQVSWYSFSDLQMTGVARLCIDCLFLMYFTKYVFQTW